MRRMPVSGLITTCVVVNDPTFASELGGCRVHVHWCVCCNSALEVPNQRRYIGGIGMVEQLRRPTFEDRTAPNCTGSTHVVLGGNVRER